MKCEAKGKILLEFPIKRGVTKNGKDWECKEYLIETNERYQSKMKFSVISFDGPIENPPKVGDKVKVFFTVEAKEAKGYWFNDVKAHRIENV